MEQVPLPGFCQCGCGEATSGPTRRFRQGHHVRIQHHRPMQGRAGELSPTWKGGRRTRGDGYVLITTGPGRKELEHRVVMERHLGRELRPEEVVHHIDRNPSNNDIENLRLYATHAEHMLTEHA